MADRERSRSRSPARDESRAGDDNYAQENGDSGVEEVKLYVGNLDYETNEDKIREAFGVFGTVTDVFLPTDRDSNRPRGFGFVTLAGRAAAEEAISKMDQSQLDNRTIRVNESRPRGDGPRGVGGFNASGRADVKLYVGNLSFETTKEAVESMFEKYGEVKDCFLPTDRNTQQPRGFAFVTMAAADAEKACELNGQEIDGRPLKVNEAQPKGASGGGGGGGRGGYGGGGYDQGGYGGGYQGGYGGRGGYDDRGGYGGGGGYGGRGGYDDRGGYGGRGGYDDRGGYGGGRGRGGGRYDQGGYDQGGYGGGYDQGYGGGGYGGKY